MTYVITRIALHATNSSTISPSRYQDSEENPEIKTPKDIKIWIHSTLDEICR